LYEDAAAATAEVNGERLIAGHVVKELRQLVTEVHLVRYLEIGDVENNDVQDRRQVLNVIVAIEARSRGGEWGRRGDWAGVLLERADRLGLFVVEDMKRGLGKAVNRVAIGVGYRDIGEHYAGAGLKGVSGLLRSWTLGLHRALSSSCGLRLRRGQVDRSCNEDGGDNREPILCEHPCTLSAKSNAHVLYTTVRHGRFLVVILETTHARLQPIAHSTELRVKKRRRGVVFS
jgi:hypothetical protein